MNVLFVLEHYHPYIGGAETLFKCLAETLTGNGFTVKVITTRFEQALPPYERINGVEIYRVDCKNRFLFSLFALPTILRHAGEADIIHTASYNAALPAWLGGFIKRKRVVITFHEAWGKLWFRLPFVGRFYRLAFYLFEQLLLWLPFERYIAVSEFTRQALIEQGIPAHKITQIYNGLDATKFRAYTHRPPPRFTYTYFGRLGISKGLDLLLPAARALRASLPDSQLVLIIPNRPVAMYRRILGMIEELELSEYVQVRHELSEADLYDQIAHSSCVVIPSYSEGFCFVAAETVEIGVPIVSSARGALQETVTGHYVEMEAMTVANLHQALLRASRNDYAFRVKKDFSLDRFSAAYLQFYTRELSEEK